MAPDPSRIEKRLGQASILAILGLAAAGCRTDESMKPLGLPTPAVIAHRGASYAAPEHTFAAYDLAIAQGADFIEQDIHRTADGVLVVLHDATLDRTMRGPAQACSGAVREHTLAEVKSCDAGDWFNSANPSRAKAEYLGLRLPTLAEVLDRYLTTGRFYIEIKDPELYPGIESDLVALLASRGIAPVVDPVAPRVVVQSFSEASLKRVHQLGPTIPLIQLFANSGSAAIAGVLSGVRGYAVGIAPHAGSVDAALVEAAHRECLLLHTYTVDAQPEMLALLAMGADGIFTNRPDLMRAAVGASGRAMLPANCSP